MFVELLQPMEFGTGLKKPGDVIDVAYSLGEDLIRQGRATRPGKKSKKDSEAGGRKTEIKKQKQSKTKTLSHPGIVDPGSAA